MYVRVAFLTNKVLKILKIIIEIFLLVLLAQICNKNDASLDYFLMRTKMFQLLI